MKELKLKDKYLELLLKVMDIDHSIIEKRSPNLNIIKGSENFFEKILDNLSNYLLKYGLENNDKINPIGDKIETLIDIVSEIYYE